MGQLRIWAENEVYGSGHGSFTGQANKVDPGASIAGDGLVPGEEMDAVHLNHQLHEHSIAAIQARLAALRSYENIYGTFSSGFQSLGGTYIDHLNVSSFAIGGEFYLIGNAPFADNVGSPLVTNLVMVVIYDKVSGRLNVIGSGTASSQYSDNDGATWTTATTQTPASAQSLGLYIKANTYLVAPLEANTTAFVQLTTDGGVNWQQFSVTDDQGRGLCRCGLDNNAVLLCGSRKIKTADEVGGYTVFTDRGNIPDEANAITDGWAASDSNGLTYLAGQYPDGLRVYSKSNPSSPWQQIALLDDTTIPAVVDVRLLVDNPTDVIHILVEHSMGTSVFSSVDFGSTWTSPGMLVGQAGDGLFVASAGRLWQRAANDVIVRSAISWGGL